MKTVTVAHGGRCARFSPGWRSFFGPLRTGFVLCLMIMFGFGVSEGAPLHLETPSFVLSGGDFSVSVPNCGDDPASVPFSVSVNGVQVNAGEKPGSELGSLSVPASAAGTLEVIVKIGDRQGKAKVRVISGWLSILPPLVAIILALITREVLTSLFLGILIGATIIHDGNILIGFLRAVDNYLLNGLADSGHAAIIIFSVTIGGMIGVINRTGGMQGIVGIISRMVVGPRTAQLAAWIMGVVIFFDDYANTLIVGNSMRPITDQNRVSREKLSYIVDSTSAPVAGVALLSTWIGYEIGLIRQAFTDLSIPETNFYGVFIQTIPFRFYCILSLFFGLMICLTKKEFGPMFTAEKRARVEGKPIADGANPISSPESAMPVLPEEMPKRWYNAAIPIAVVIFGTMAGLIYSGGGFDLHQDATAVYVSQADASAEEFVLDRVQPDVQLLIGRSDERGPMKVRYGDQTPVDGITGTDSVKVLEGLQKGKILQVKTGPATLTTSEKLRAAFCDANSSMVLIWVAFSGSILAIFLGWIQGLVNLEKGVAAWVNGAKSMVLAMCVLLMAWCINGVCKDLHTAEFIVNMTKGILTPQIVPAMVFIIACLISFATGTSWGTMAILLPISIPLAYHLNVEYYNSHLAGQPGALPMMVYIKQMLFVSIGAVLEGSIFGDHCSPISDTTIMSSMASGSDHIDHVRTQMPYAMAPASAALLFGYIPAAMGFNPFYLIPLCMIYLIVLLQVLGRDVPDAPSAA